MHICVYMQSVSHARSDCMHPLLEAAMRVQQSGWSATSPERKTIAFFERVFLGSGVQPSHQSG